MTDPSDSSTPIYLVLLLTLAVVMPGASGFLALRNIRDGRGEFVMRVIFRRGWLAGVAFTLALAGLNAMNPPHGVNTLIGLLYYGSAAFVIVRWGLLPFAVGTFVNSVLFDFVATGDTSAWYFGNSLAIIGLVGVLAVWGFWKAVPREMARRAPVGHSL
jgi:hypothetical protein